MKRCTACGRQYRKGTVAYIAGAEGGLKRAVVCETCAREGSLIVPKTQAARCACGATATQCHACATGAERRDKAKDVAGAIKTIEGWRTMAERQEGLLQSDEAKARQATKVEAFDSVLELLKSGRFTS